MHESGALVAESDRGDRERSAPIGAEHLTGCQGEAFKTEDRLYDSGFGAAREAKILSFFVSSFLVLDHSAAGGVLSVVLSIGSAGNSRVHPIYLRASNLRAMDCEVI